MLFSEFRKDEGGNKGYSYGMWLINNGHSSSPIDGWGLFPFPWTSVGLSDLEPTECTEVVLCEAAWEGGVQLLSGSLKCLLLATASWDPQNPASRMSKTSSYVQRTHGDALVGSPGWALNLLPASTASHRSEIFWTSVQLNLQKTIAIVKLWLQCKGGPSCNPQMSFSWILESQKSWMNMVRWLPWATGFGDNLSCCVNNQVGKDWLEWNDTTGMLNLCKSKHAFCVCVCVCVREREREI